MKLILPLHTINYRAQDSLIKFDLAEENDLLDMPSTYPLEFDNNKEYMLTCLNADSLIGGVVNTPDEVRFCIYNALVTILDDVVGTDHITDVSLDSIDENVLVLNLC